MWLLCGEYALLLFISSSRSRGEYLLDDFFFPGLNHIAPLIFCFLLLKNHGPSSCPLSVGPPPLRHKRLTLSTSTHTSTYKIFLTEHCLLLLPLFWSFSLPPPFLSILTVKTPPRNPPPTPPPPLALDKFALSASLTSGIRLRVFKTSRSARTALFF